MNRREFLGSGLAVAAMPLVRRKCDAAANDVPMEERCRDMGVEHYWEDVAHCHAPSAGRLLDMRFKAIVGGPKGPISYRMAMQADTRDPMELARLFDCWADSIRRFHTRCIGKNYVRHDDVDEVFHIEHERGRWGVMGSEEEL